MNPHFFGQKMMIWWREMWEYDEIKLQINRKNGDFCRGHGTMLPWPSSMDETHLKLLQKQLVTSYNRWKYICFCVLYDWDIVRTYTLHNSICNFHATTTQLLRKACSSQRTNTLRWGGAAGSTAPRLSKDLTTKMWKKNCDLPSGKLT